MGRSGREPSGEKQYFAALEALRKPKRLLAGFSNASSILALTTLDVRLRATVRSSN